MQARCGYTEREDLHEATMTPDEQAELHRLRSECAQLREHCAEQARARTALEASLSEYREFVERAQEGIWAIDTTEKTTFVNPCMAEMIGYEVDEILGKRLQDFTDETHARVTDANVKRRRSGIAESLDFAFVHRDGHPVHVRVNTWPMFDDQGTYRGAVAFMVDTTEERQLEERLERAQKMESLAVMAGGVAHDFNNLLVGVLANAALARQLIGDAAEAQAVLEQIEHAARTAAELTRQMLTYAGRSTPRTSLLDVCDAVRDIEALVRAALPKGVVVQIVTPDEPLLAEADPGQLRQVVMNLILNAAESLQERSGKVTVRVGASDMSAADLSKCWIDDDLPAGRYITIDVIDRGCGMSGDTLARIFEPFFTTRETGRGLGLAAVLGIVRAHRGGLRVRSQVGRGTSIRVLLPISASAPVTQPTRAVSGSTACVGGHVLVVDDEPVVRQVARRVLERGGYVVTTAVDAGDALEKFYEDPEQWCAVVLDVTMPDRSGVEVMHEMLERRADLPVVLSTGYAADALVDAGDAAHILEKPWDPRMLLQAVRGVIG